MKTIKTSGLSAVGLAATLMLSAAGTVSAADLTMWARDSAVTLTQNIVDKWNETHGDNQIELTIIPSNEMVTKFATAANAGDVPDLLSVDLIFAPPFMRSGLFDDITDFMADDPNIGKTVPAHLALGTYDDRLFAVPFTPDNSVLIWNKDLFRQAGLDPDKAPASSSEILEAARAINALGDDISGYYFSGACGGCNIFTLAPQMWAVPDTAVLPDQCGTEPLQGESIRTILQHYRTMWEEGLMPETAQVDNGSNFIATFLSGKVGIQGTGNFAIGVMNDQAPDIDFGIGFLPGPEDGQASSFAGGDILAIPSGSKNIDAAREFLKWVLTDEPQIEIYAASGNLPVRTDLADNEYFSADERLAKTVAALSIAKTPFTYNFFELSNDPTGPWLEMLQSAIFDGDIDGAISYAKERMTSIVCDS